MNGIERITYYEKLYDETFEAINQVKTGLRTYKEIWPKIEELQAYYNKEYLNDVRKDDDHEFPQDLKRGILSEDALYDLFTEWQAIKEAMEELLNK